mmetsp:Transcript_4771/g.11032  ORF Transcript_4771/g.11032 Transcript_4771/m.11032 type:complete len:222 (-) Transcript_4771:438-1103(-)
MAQHKAPPPAAQRHGPCQRAVSRRRAHVSDSHCDGSCVECSQWQWHPPHGHCRRGPTLLRRRASAGHHWWWMDHGGRREHHLRRPGPCNDSSRQAPPSLRLRLHGRCVHQQRPTERTGWLVVCGAGRGGRGQRSAVRPPDQPAGGAVRGRQGTRAVQGFSWTACPPVHGLPVHHQVCQRVDSEVALQRMEERQQRPREQPGPSQDSRCAHTGAEWLRYEHA